MSWPARLGLSRRPDGAATPAPRFVVRVVAIAFATVAGVLAAVSSVLVLETRAVVERGIADDLAAAHRQLAASQRERQREAQLRASLISSSPGVRAVLESYQEERAFGGDDVAGRRLASLQIEVDRIAGLLRTDGLAIVGLDGRVVVSAGDHAPTWPPGTTLLSRMDDEASEPDQVLQVGGEVFRATVAAVTTADGLRLGYLVDARLLDATYAAELAGAARSDIAILVDDRLVASVSAGPSPVQLAARLRKGDVAQASGAFEAGGEHFGYLLVQRAGPAAIYAVASITAARDRATGAAAPRFLAIVAGSLVLCVLASVALARRVAAPIDRVSREIHALVRADSPEPTAVPDQAIQELDALGADVTSLLQTVHAARAETASAYLGAIRALVAALDARDPYTAGHSERVSLLSVAMGQAMGLGQEDLDVLRLGALLHDIGKIGIADAILTKPTQLDAEEFAIIQRHPTLGAQILRPIGFLEAHVPIVELHHEQPDGKGYPYGLCGAAIPIHARIVHVADAYDAMTTARAYRRGRPPVEVLSELRRHAGTEFDPASLDGLAAVVASLRAEIDPLAQRRAS